MIRLVYLLQRVGLMRQRPDIPTTNTHARSDHERIVRTVVERLSEDETLRGELTDAAFAPILSLVTSLVPAAARRALAASSVDDAEEAISRAARTLTRAMVTFAATGIASGLPELLVPPIVSSDASTRAQQAMSADPPTGTNPEERARQIVGLLTETIQETGG